jgi:peptidoglycan/xylan/chitin deacetylase (PgdA/CDA1 family)
MCPSSKRYDKKLFEYLDELGRKRGQPVPVAIAASGKWITRHMDELEEIRRMFLDITWVNHSYSHPVEDGFLLSPRVNFTREVEEAARVFRQHHLKVSRFFRFPGLKHDRERLKMLSEMGYIALDADAWLGKGQKIRGGSIVLIHGNGNEAPGVIDGFINYLKSREDEIIKGKFRIVSIEAFSK